MKTYLSFLLIFSTALVFSQKEVVVKNNWSVVKTQESIFKISKRIVEVNDKKNDIYKSYYQYKFENETEEKLSINWNFITQYKNFSSTNLPTNENYRALTLDPGQTFVPDFLDIEQKKFFVFNKFLNRPTKVSLESVEFHQLKYKLL
ncbi:hypothetical protein [Lacinutrix sp. Bg11-31]|uniref:hypothetical protein n=1 Tax=Lacinutrix sp. Bg11-31 TaxID=2057808 RepID=UPI000C3087F1|nr:hypothetical protein [Lacinutrix sp. Bg11-31]AUC81373.1 hypothetical protein CW733_04175 [Lacinutrix sp. Bg11-31]